MECAVRNSNLLKFMRYSSVCAVLWRIEGETNLVYVNCTILAGMEPLFAVSLFSTALVYALIRRGFYMCVCEMHL